MLNKNNISVFIFIVAIIGYFYIDYKQVDFEMSSDFRKLFVFNGRNIVQSLIGVSIALQFNRFYSVIAYGWAFYNIENIYYRLLKDSIYELPEWSISIICILLTCLIRFYYWRRCLR